MRVLVTGSTGFVGRELVSRLLQHPGIIVRVAFRSSTFQPACPGEVFLVGSSFVDTEWRDVVEDVDVIIHLAARVHVMQDDSDDPLAEFRRVNVDGTLALARQAAVAGVRRFIFLSTIKVNGEATQPGCAFSPEDKPNPTDAYAISKMEAEIALQELASLTGMEVVIIRPPLIYGPGVKANFRTIMRLVNSGAPLPLGAIHNQRSLVAVDNLIALLIRCIDHPAAANQIFLVSDGEDLSTTQLLRRLARALGKPVRLIPFPANWLEASAALIGKRHIAQRLCGSLQVDITKACELLDWSPPVTVDEGLQRAVHGYIA